LLDDRADSPTGQDSIDLNTLLAEAREQARREFQFEAAALVEAARRDERTESTDREVKMAAEWSARCAGVTADAMAGLLRDLQFSVGCALSDILRPLLPEAMRRKAISEMSEMIGVAFATTPGGLVEVRAPPAMHSKLRELLNRLKIEVSLVESDKIEIVSRDEISHFELLSGAWAELVLREDS
jgi:hypothetical protein